MNRRSMSTKIRNNQLIIKTLASRINLTYQRNYNQSANWIISILFHSVTFLTPNSSSTQIMKTLATLRGSGMVSFKDLGRVISNRQWGAESTADKEGWRLRTSRRAPLLLRRQCPNILTMKKDQWHEEIKVKPKVVLERLLATEDLEGCLETLY